MSTEPTPQPEIENLMSEGRTFAPDPAFAAQANAGPGLYPEAEADFEAFWAKHARERLRWAEPFHTTLEWNLPFAKWFLGGRLNVVGELPRPARRERARRQGRLPLDRRAGGHPDADLRGPAARGRQGCQRPQGARRRDRRPGRDLHADDPRAADRDARLRPPRSSPHGDLRRLFGRGPVRPDQRRPGQGPDHGRRRLAPGQGGRAQAPRRRSPGLDPLDHRLDRSQPDRRGRPHGRGPRPLVA